MKFDKNKLHECIEVRSGIATREPFCIMPDGTIWHECEGCEFDPRVTQSLNNKEKQYINDSMRHNDDLMKRLADL